MMMTLMKMIIALAVMMLNEVWGSAIDDDGDDNKGLWY